MISTVKKLLNYRRAPRNTMPDSLPRWVEDELDKVSGTTANIIEVLKALDKRLAALEPQKP